MATAHLVKLRERVYSGDEGEQRGAEFEVRVLGSLTDDALSGLELDYAPPELGGKDLDFLLPKGGFAIEAMSIQAELVPAAQLNPDMTPRTMRRLLNMAGAKYSLDVAGEAADLILTAVTQKAGAKGLDRVEIPTLILVDDQHNDFGRAALGRESLQELTDRFQKRMAGLEFRSRYHQAAFAMATLDGHGGGRVFLPQGLAAWPGGTENVAHVFRPDVKIEIRHPAVQSLE